METYDFESRDRPVRADLRWMPLVLACCYAWFVVASLLAPFRFGRTRRSNPPFHSVERRIIDERG